MQLVVGKPPETSDEDPARVLAVGKMNIAMKPSARAFSIVSADGGGVSTSCVEWGGVSTSTAADLTRARGGDTPAAPARSEVEDWLREELTGRERLAREMWDEAKENDFARNTVKRALKSVGVDVYRSGYGSDGGWKWRLTPVEDERDKGTQQPDGDGKESLVPYSVGPFDDRGSLWENGPSEADYREGEEHLFSKEAKGTHDLGNGDSLVDRSPHGDALPDGDLLQIDIPDEDEVDHA